MARQPSALDAREMFAHGVDLADIGAGAQQRARHRLLVGKRHAGRRRDPVGRGAARHQHEHEIVGAGAVGQLDRRRSAASSPAASGTGWPASTMVTIAGRAAIAVPRHRDAAQPASRQIERVEIMRFRRPRPLSPAALPAASRMTRPFGTGGSSFGRKVAGWAASTAMRYKAARKARAGSFFVSTICAHVSKTCLYRQIGRQAYEFAAAGSVRQKDAGRDRRDGDRGHIFQRVT